MQAVWPKEKTAQTFSSYCVSAVSQEEIPIFIYNFSTNYISGKLKISAPENWKIDFPGKIIISPEERKKLILKIDTGKILPFINEKINVLGKFGSFGNSQLSINLFTVADDDKLPPSHVKKIKESSDAGRWIKNAANTNNLIITESQNGIISVKARDSSWVFPTFELKKSEMPDKDFDALAFDFKAGKSKADYKIMLEEKNGSCYVSEMMIIPVRDGNFINEIAAFKNFVHGGAWAKLDPNNKLDIDKIKSIKIGGTTSEPLMNYNFKNLKWIKFNKK